MVPALGELVTQQELEAAVRALSVRMAEVDGELAAARERTAALEARAAESDRRLALAGVRLVTLESRLAAAVRRGVLGDVPAEPRPALGEPVGVQ